VNQTSKTSSSSLLGRIDVRLVEQSATRLLGLLWFSGGLLLVGWGLIGIGPDGWPAGVLALGAFAVALGALLLSRLIASLQLWLAAALTLLGSLVICLVVLWSGDGRTGAPAVLFVYVSVYACVALRRWRWPVMALSLAGHVVTLYLVGSSVALVEPPMIWGAAIVAGLVVGHAVESTRSAALEREELLEQLRAADASKTAFLRAAGHDLATPAALVAGLAETVIVRGEHLEAEDRRELLERVAANARRLQGDLKDLLHLGQLADGRMEPDRQTVDLREVIDGAIARAGLVDGQVVVGTFQAGTAMIDAAKVEHAIANLLTNADKYASDGGPVTVSVARTDEHIVVRVDDEGPGIPEEHLETVFEPFVRGRDEHVRLGSGVGLSIVRAFARLHGGDSWAELREGGGLRMSFSMHAQPSPLATADDDGSRWSRPMS
jgi:signal transduction histidine kinase